MIIDDKYKRLSLKILELENRINSLEKNQEEVNYQELEFSFKKITGASRVEKSIKINALKEGAFRISGKMLSNIAVLLGVNVKFYINDIMCYSYICCVNTDFIFDFRVALLKGENTLKIILASPFDLDIEYLNFQVNGFVDYTATENDIYHMSCDNIDYILHKNSDEVSLLTFTESEGLVKKTTISNVSCCNFIGYDTNSLYVAYCDMDNMLYLLVINKSTYSIQSICLNVSGVTSVAGYKFGSQITILFCKLYDLHKLLFNTNTNEFTYKNTGRKSNKVYANANLLGAYITVDRYNNSKLVIE